MTHTYYVELDVHKETISIAHAHAHALGGGREEPTYHGRCAGSIAAATTGLQKLAAKINVEFSDLKVCYEAPPVLSSPDITTKGAWIASSCRPPKPNANPAIKVQANRALDTR